MKHRFTLLEIVVATAILATVVLSALSVSGGCLIQSMSAVQNWRDTHCLVQAAEYFLTIGPEGGGIDPALFPYPDCSALCYLEQPESPPDLLHLNDLENPSRTLKTLRIQVRWRERDQVSEMTVDKLVYTGLDES